MGGNLQSERDKTLKYPLIGSFYQEHKGIKYYLRLDTDGVKLVGNPDTNPRLALCGDHFKTQIQAGYSLLTADELWQVAKPAGPGQARTYKCNHINHSGVALFQPVFEEGRIASEDKRFAFQTTGTGKSLVLQTAYQNEPVTGGEVRTRRVLFVETNSDIPESAFFKYEPDPHLSDFYFWISNISTRHVLETDDNNPQYIKCVARQDKPRQLWRFEGTHLVTFSGRALDTATIPASGNTLHLSDKPSGGGGVLLLGGGSLYHVGENGKYAVAEETRGHEPILTMRDPASPAQQWAIIPYRIAHHCGIDRFMAFEGRLAFMILDPTGDLAWTRDADGRVILSNPATPPKPEQLWFYSRGYLYDDQFQKILVTKELTSLICVSTNHGTIPADYADQLWGMTSGGYIIPRTGTKWAATSSEKKVVIGPSILTVLRYQQWQLAPVETEVFAGAVEPVQQTTVQEFLKDGNFLPHPKFGVAIGEIKKGALTVAYLTPEGGMALVPGSPKFMQFSGGEVWHGGFSATPVNGIQGDNPFVVNVLKDSRHVQVVTFENGYTKENYKLVSDRGPLQCASQPIIVQNTPSDGGVWLFLHGYKSGDRNYMVTALFTPNPSRPYPFFIQNTSYWLGNGAYINPAMVDYKDKDISNILIPPAMIFLEKCLYRLAFLRKSLNWDCIDMGKRRDMWEDGCHAYLPAGIEAVAGAPAVLPGCDHIQLAFTCSDHTIWTAEFYPGRNSIRRLRRVARTVPARPIHPSMVTAFGQRWLAYNGEDNKVHIMALP